MKSRNDSYTDEREKVSLETVLMDATDDIWINKDLIAPAENDCSYDEWTVYSFWGSLIGNRDAMSLTLDMTVAIVSGFLIG